MSGDPHGRSVTGRWPSVAAVRHASPLPLVLLVVCWSACLLEEPEVVQPIAFSHSIHVGRKKIPCTDCHVGAKRGIRATLPPLTRCLLCHMKPQGRQPNPREQMVRKLAAEGDALIWTQVTRNPRHVYFSHRAHTTLADLSCDACHGDVSEWKTPPGRPNKNLMRMDTCRGCHRERHATTDCINCHHY